MFAWINAICRRRDISIVAAAVLFSVSAALSLVYGIFNTFPILVLLLSALVARIGKRVAWWHWLCGGALIAALAVYVDLWENTGWMLLLFCLISCWVAVLWYGRAAARPISIILLGALLIPVVIDEGSLHPVLSLLSVMLAAIAGLLLGYTGSRLSGTPGSCRPARVRLKRAIVGVVLPVCALGVLWVVFIINNRPPHFNPPIPSQLKVNGWDDFVRAAEIIQIDQSLVNYIDFDRYYLEPPALHAELYQKNKAALPVIHEGLGKPFQYPYTPSTFTTDWEEEKRLHSAPGIKPRTIARILAAEAVHYQQLGEYDRAAGSCMDIVDFSMRLPRGKGLGIETACSVESYGLSCLARILQELGSRELDIVAQRLEKLQKARLPFKSLVVDAAGIDAEYQASKFSNEVFRRWWADPYHWFGPDMEYYLNSESRMSQAWRNTCFAFCNKQKLVQRNYDYMLELAREYDKPYGKQDEVAFPGGMIAESLLDDVCEGKITYTQAQARFVVVKTAVALRRHLLENGTYPRSLEDLVPTYLKQLPTDPFRTNCTLAYKHINEGRFVLYSLGPDMKDNGGKNMYEDDISFDSLLPKARRKPDPMMPPMPSPPGTAP